MELFLWVSGIIIYVISAFSKILNKIGIRIPGRAILQSKYILRKAQLAHNLSVVKSQPMFQKVVVVTG